MNWNALNGADGVSEVALQCDACLEDVGDRAERFRRLGPDRAVVARVGLVQHREAVGVLRPVEAPAVDDHAADRGAVAADVLGRRVDDHVRAVIERPADHRRRRVVDDQRHAELLADGRNLGDREDVQLRIGQGLRIVGPGPFVGRAAERLGILGIDEAHLDAHGLEGVGEEIPGAAVEVGRADDVVAGLGDVLDRDRGRGLAGAHRQGGGAAFHGRDALLEHIAGRVHDPGVDIAELFQGEEVDGVFGAVELIGGGLVDRHGDRAGGRVGAVAGMQGDGFRIGGIDHECTSSLSAS